MEYLIILVVCLAVFFRSLKYGLVVDDIDNRARVKYPLGFFERIRRALDGYRPIESVFLDHCLTLTIHITVCMLIYFAFGSLAASLLFAVNVSNNQVSLWLNGKRYGINTILCLLTYVCCGFGVVFWVLTPFFQISAMSFFLVMLVKGCWWFLLFVPLLVFVGRYTLFAKIKLKIDSCKTPKHIDWNNKKIFLVLKTISFYFFRGLIPFIPVMYIEYLQTFGLREKDNKKAYRFDLDVVVGLIIVLAIPVLYHINQVMFFGLVWWLLTIIVFGNFVTLTVPLAERYMYLPNVGLMVCLASVLSLIHPWLWIVVFCIYAARLLTFMPMYRDINKFLEHHCYHNPTNDASWNFRTNSSAKHGDILTMAYLTDAGLSANQDSPRLWIHRASCLRLLGQKDLALQCIDNAKKYATGLFGELLKDKINDVENRIKKGE